MLQQLATIHPVLSAVVGSLALLLGAALADLVTRRGSSTSESGDETRR